MFSKYLKEISWDILGAGALKKLSACIVLGAAVLLTGCQSEEEFKIPTDVGFQMDINREVSPNARLNFTSGRITLTSFSFDGRREEGGDVYFTKNYAPELLLNFAPNTPIEALQFSIPQGNYTRIEIEFDTYDELGESGLVVNGSYLHSNGIHYPLRLELGTSLDFEIEAREASGSPQVVLRRDTPATAVIKLDPVKWFELVPLSYLDNAVMSVEEGESEGELEVGSSYILISEEVNENIYEIILSRVEQSATVVFH